jgi:hypothetical protein
VQLSLARFLEATNLRLYPLSYKAAQKYCQSEEIDEMNAALVAVDRYYAVANACGALALKCQLSDPSFARRSEA